MPDHRPSFKEWLLEVDAILVARVQFRHDQLIGWYWYDYYIKQIPAFEAVDWAIVDMGLSIQISPIGGK